MLSLISHFLVNNMKEGTVSDFRKKKKKKNVARRI